MKRPADNELALPSPPAESVSRSQSPEASPEAESHPNGPPRKRSRTGITPEERREARAHRNRIAAQNSRDRRKAQFTYLERRVAELEEENRQLRAGMGLAELSRSEDPRVEERERDRARERENQELKERIKTLETGWDAVMKALAASGLPLNIPSVSSASSSSASSTPSSTVTSTSPSAQPPTTTFPVLVPPSPVFPISPAPSTPSTTTPLFDFDFDDFDPTRHLARVATTDAPLLSSVPQQRIQFDIDTSATQFPPPVSTPADEATASAVDESAMDDLFREILAASPAPASASLPACAPTLPAERSPTGPVAAPPSRQGWSDEAEMQRLLNMLPDVRRDAAVGAVDLGLDLDFNLDMDQNAGIDFPSALDLNLEFGTWEPGTVPPAGSAVVSPWSASCTFASRSLPVVLRLFPFGLMKDGVRLLFAVMEHVVGGTYICGDSRDLHRIAIQLIKLMSTVSVSKSATHGVNTETAPSLFKLQLPFREVDRVSICGEVAEVAGSQRGATQPIDWFASLRRELKLQYLRTVHGVFSGTSATEAHWLKAHWSMSRVAAMFGAASSAGFPQGPPNSAYRKLVPSAAEPSGELVLGRRRNSTIHGLPTI
ncbi:hypothetical protein OBBRIDRAFT_823917 [Obba rivulosa]|uniref:X-box-binding protein 1 n=1 Tax=Obba rivulosa TaxID=1052685 RepID=A0A8E2J3C1_9APHY|nr:hypothetical protein OBBRIDRAFT_823917 [Obba rivulosa]